MLYTKLITMVFCPVKNFFDHKETRISLYSFPLFENSTNAMTLGAGINNHQHMLNVNVKSANTNTMRAVAVQY